MLDNLTQRASFDNADSIAMKGSKATHDRRILMKKSRSKKNSKSLAETRIPPMILFLSSPH